MVSQIRDSAVAGLSVKFIKKLAPLIQERSHCIRNWFRVSILHALSTGPDLSKINWALSIFPLSGKIYVINFSHLHKLA